MQELGGIDQRRVYAGAWGHRPEDSLWQPSLCTWDPFFPEQYISIHHLFYCLGLAASSWYPGTLLGYWEAGRTGRWGVGDRQEVLPLKLNPRLGRVRRYSGRE